VLGSIFQSRLRGALAPALTHTPVAGHTAAVARAVAGGAAPGVLAKVPVGLRPRAESAIHTAFAGALSDILLVGALIAFAGAVLALALVRSRDFASYGAPLGADAAAAAA